MGRLANDRLAVASGREQWSAIALMKVHRVVGKGHVTSVNLLECPSRKTI